MWSYSFTKTLERNHKGNTSKVNHPVRVTSCFSKKGHESMPMTQETSWDSQCIFCKGTLRIRRRKCGHIVIGLVRVTVSNQAHLALPPGDLAEWSPLCHGYMQGRLSL